jgi:uncharacterized membrane protein
VSKRNRSFGGGEQHLPAHLEVLQTEEHRAILEAWSGPLPPPAILREYEDIVPGGAQAIMEEFRAEAAHRRQFENRALRAAIFDNHMGRIAATVSALISLGIVFYCASHGQEVIGAAVATTTTVGVVAALLVNNRKK